MKEIYERPDIMFEDFSLSTNIAGNCEGFVGNPTDGTCGILLSDGNTVFVNKETGCTYEMGENYVHDGLCYHVPVDDKNLFNS